MQVAQQHVADLRRQNPHSLQDVVQVRLRNARSAGETPFRQFAALYALLHVLDEAMLQEFKIHKPQGETDFPLK